MAQNPFPSYSDSAKWSTLLVDLGIGVQGTTIHYYYEKDTTMCGFNYSKLIKNHFGVNSVAGYFRNVGSKTYVRLSTNCNNKEFLIYDYSLSVNDSIYIPNFYPYDSTSIKVTQIDSIAFNGIKRKAIHFNKPNSTKLVWIEGIGSNISPDYYNTCIRESIFCESIWNLLCCEIDTMLLYKDTTYNTCDTTYGVGINEITAAYGLVKVFPNPAQNFITVNIEQAPEKCTLSLTNLLGEIVLTHNEKNTNLITINTQPLPNGTYLLNINNTVYRKIIISR